MTVAASHACCRADFALDRPYARRKLMRPLCFIRGLCYFSALTAAARSIMVFKTNEDKILELSSSKAVAMSGPQGDRAHFGEFIQVSFMLCIVPVR